jgi:putative acetyltransferase
VALQHDKIVGRISFIQINIREGTQNTPVLSLAPMAVLPEYQNQGIGSGLVREGLQRCRGMG